jgi:uncharacterized protein YllA (UPF0747 family)
LDLPKANYHSVKDLLDKNSESIDSQPSFSLQNELPLINRLFSIDTNNFETIFEQLKSDGSNFALKQLSILEKMVRSFSSLLFKNPFFFRVQHHLN